MLKGAKRHVPRVRKAAVLGFPLPAGEGLREREKLALVDQANYPHSSEDNVRRRSGRRPVTMLKGGTGRWGHPGGTKEKTPEKPLAPRRQRQEKDG